MRSLCFILFLVSVGAFQTQAQSIKVQPYLQDATPKSIYILWETDQGEESTVEWGLTDSLGQVANGTSISSVGNARIHEVKLEGLNRYTTYYYRVKTGPAISEIHSFKTPPMASMDQDFRIIAMSDMQRDGNHPDKFMEIIEDGIITFLSDESGGALHDDLALVLIPGDLVENGNSYSQWEHHFFSPAASLFSQVPVYPAIGNHEGNSEYYFQYFRLPDNGSPGLEEHWWYKDYGNVRIIGLDSNAPFTTPEQLDWLDAVLSESCGADSIDFVFAQLHHPYKSELWLPGESNFTGDVVSRLETFSTDCRKPSIHFFGHTHGYSRGQSRDHKHLWINVATAGGAIDHWGDYPQFDYDEFSVSQDEWGFVSVEVEAGEDARLTIRRVSRGNESHFRQNEITDSFSISVHPGQVVTPDPLFPVEELVRPDCVILKAGNFSSGDSGARHGQSHWQVSEACDDFSDPVIDIWKNYQNIYFYDDTQMYADLSEQQIIGLVENTSYCWRLRYRDRELNWSEWSEPVSFTTGQSSASPNLLINAGSESELFEWNIIEGTAESLTDGECNGISPHSGMRYFAVGGVCEDGAYGKCVQNVNVVALSDSIDPGGMRANFGGFLSNYNGNDLPSMRLMFFSEHGEILDSSQTISSFSSNWTMFEEWTEVPALTRIIQFELTGTRNSGSDNDSYFDDLFLRIGREESGCDEYTTRVADPSQSVPKLYAFPNPWSRKTTIPLPPSGAQNIKITIRNMLGQEVYCRTLLLPDRIILERSNLAQGTYHFMIVSGIKPIGRGRFIVN